MLKRRLNACSARLLSCSAAMIFVTSVVLAAEQNTASRHFECDRFNVRILADNMEAARTICEGAGAAQDFLEAQGFDVSDEFTVEVVSALPQNVRTGAAGCFLSSCQKVLLLSYDKFLGFREWFGLPVDRSLYLGLATHEAAHAIAACNFEVPMPTLQAQEYIAYVTMLATMEPGLRETVLSQYPGDGYETDQQMSTTIYLFDPMRFGVEAYRHYLKEADGRGYLHAILSGRALSQ